MLGFGWERTPPGTLGELKNRSEGVGKQLGKAIGSQDVDDQAYLTKLKRSESKSLQNHRVFVGFCEAQGVSDLIFSRFWVGFRAP